MAGFLLNLDIWISLLENKANFA